MVRWIRNLLLAAIVLVVIVLSWAALDFCACTEPSYLVKSKLTKVVSTLDPVKAKIAEAHERSGKMPVASTPVTAANQGKAVTSDWAALGFALLPFLPPEVKALSVNPGGEIIVVLTHIAEGIDDSEVHVIPNPQPGTWSWTYKCTSEDRALKRYFRC